MQGGRPGVKDFPEDYHLFLVDYVVCGNSHRRFPLRFPSSIPKNIDFCPCPKQRNGIDCGIFAVPVLLHIIDGIPVTVDMFSQEIITSLRNLYHPNVIPVIVDTIKYNGKTKSPIRAKRAAGRPKVKMYQRRSELLDASQSRIKCSLCDERGHNRCTCNSPKTAALEQLSL